MNRLLSLLVACSVTMVMAADEPKEFSPKDSGMKIQFPGTPKLIENDVSGIKVKNWVVERKNGAEAFGISVTSLPNTANDDKKMTEKRLDGSRDGFIKAVKGNLVQETKISLENKYSGREVLASMNGGKVFILTRYYMVKGRIYQIMAFGNKEFIDSDEVKSFLDSFELTKQLPAK